MQTVGFIGLGLMGEAMCGNILRKFDGQVVVFDLNPTAMERMVAQGARAASSICTLGEQADVIISMVPKSEHVRAVYRDLLPVLKAGQITIDMSSIDPAVSADIARQVAETGARMLDAPVVKSVPAAVKGELGIYVSGDEAAYTQVRPLLAMMGCNQIHLGANGRGLVMKALHNTLVAQIQNSVNEMLATAEHFGISKADFNTAVSYGGGSNFYLTSKIDALINDNYTTAFSLENMAKDIGIMRTLMQENNLALPGVDVVHSVYQQGLATELGQEDFCATFKVVKQNLN
ncbi:MAG: NAD(P)-dependent oxidoreductase [Aeromonas sp.]